MHVLVHCDDQISCSEALIQRVEGVIAGTLEHFSGRIARIEAHLCDLNTPTRGDRDKVCSLEARFAGGTSVLASHEAATLTEAIHDAADKLKRVVARELQQLDQVLRGNPQASLSSRPTR
jgi:ribosome-associated translation inhibitor RaiA